MYTVQFSSLSRVRLCNPMDCSTPGLPVHHQLLEFAQTQCPLSQCCHPTISSSVIPFFSCLQSFPTLESFRMSQFFASGGQSIGASALALPMNIQGWFPLGWTALISLLSKGLSGVFSSSSSKASILWCSAFFMVQLSHPCMNTRKTIALTIQIFVGKVGTAFSHPYPAPQSPKSFLLSHYSSYKVHPM